jgi:hypothetical protein
MRRTQPAQLNLGTSCSDCLARTGEFATDTADRLTLVEDVCRHRKAESQSTRTRTLEETAETEPDVPVGGSVDLEPAFD